MSRKRKSNSTVMAPVDSQFPRIVTLTALDRCGCKFEIANPVEAYRIEQYGGEEAFTQAILSELKPTDVFFDIGACVGLVSVHAARIAARVVAFEPDPAARSRLEANLRLNHLENVHIADWAVSNTLGEALLFTDPAGNSASLRDLGDRSQVTVRTNTLDQALANGELPAPNVIKIDIEGAEILALQGMLSLLASTRAPRAIFVEIHPDFLSNFGAHAETVFSFLAGLGYLTAHLADRDRQVHAIFRKASPGAEVSAADQSVALSSIKLAHYKDCHSDQRCVIIGNGPSLNQMDLSFLKDEITIGMNRIYLGFEKWGFTPTYYLSINPLVMEQSAAEIEKITCPKFLSHKGISYIQPGENTTFLRCIDWPLNFSRDPLQGIHEGHTVTYAAMQLAYYMGFREVVLIGVDHNFPAAAGNPNQEVTATGTDANHFDPNYFGKGVRWQLPDLENSEKSYRLAKQVFEDNGRIILDATLGGKLEIFPKLDYRKIFFGKTKLATQDMPEEAALVLQQADQAFSQDGPERALGYLRQAVELAPANAQLHTMLANVLLQAGDMEGAWVEFGASTVFAPADAAVFVNLAAVGLHLERYDEAERAARRALVLQPDQPDALKILGRLCLDSQRFEEGLMATLSVLRCNPEDVDALLMLGNCYLEGGDPARSRDLFEQVLKFDPGNALATARLEQALAALCEPKTAISPAGAPLITVITPSYNQGQYIEQAIQSVLTQNYANFEHIIVDGGSTDGTLEIFKKYPHLKWISEKDSGQSEALNKALKMSGGEIIAWLNSDDVYAPGAFAQVTRAFAANPNAQIVLGDCLFFFEESGKMIQRKPMIVQNRDLGFEDLLRYWNDWIPPTQPSIFFKANLLCDVGEFDLNLHKAMDYDLWLRIAEKHRLLHVPHVLAHYRFHAASKSALGDDWAPFYSEWHSVHLRYKQYSHVLPVSPLITAAIPLSQEDFQEPGRFKAVQNLVEQVGGQIVRDIEILLVSDAITSTSDLQALFDVPVPLRLIHVEKLNTESFPRAVWENAQGFAVNCPIPGVQPQPGWYARAIDHLLDEPTRTRYQDGEHPASHHPLLPSDCGLGPNILLRRSRALELSESRAFPTPSAPIAVFSIVIPTYNRSVTLRKCLDALAAQTFPKEYFEVIVCDDGSTDPTQQVVKDYPTPYALTYLRQENRGPAAARNLGIARARGEFLLILNDDALLEPDALALHYANQSSYGDAQVAILGRFSLFPEFTRTPFGYLLEHSDLLFAYGTVSADRFYELQAGQTLDFRYFYTCNISLPLRAVQQAGGFDEHFTAPAAEDLDLGFRLQKTGLALYYDPRIIAWHDHRITPESFCRTHIMRSRWSVDLCAKHPEIGWFRGFTRSHLEDWKRLDVQMAPKVADILDHIQKIQRNAQALSEEHTLRRQALQLYPLVKFVKEYHDRKGALSNPILEQLARGQIASPHPVHPSKGAVPGASPTAPREEPSREAGGRRRRSKSHSDSAGRQTPYLSVIIPTYNRKHSLEKCLQFLTRQNLSAGEFEVIVVDDGSADGTGEWLEKQSFPFSLQYFHQPNMGPGMARNRGITKALGEVVLFIGDDIYAAPGLLAGHAEYHRQFPQLGEAVVGHIAWYPEAPVTPFMEFIVGPSGAQFAFDFIKDPEHAGHQFFYTSNISLKRRFLAAQRPPFDPDYWYPAWEDIDLGYRLEQRGMRLRYRPRLLAYHDHPTDPGQFAHRQYYAGKMARLFASKHPESGLAKVTESVYRRSLSQAENYLSNEQDTALLELVRQCECGFTGVQEESKALHQLYAQILERAYVRGILAGQAREVAKSGGATAPISVG